MDFVLQTTMSWMVYLEKCNLNCTSNAQRVIGVSSGFFMALLDRKKSLSHKRAGDVYFKICLAELLSQFYNKTKTSVLQLFCRMLMS